MDHEIPVHIVDNQEYMKVVRSILEEGQEGSGADKKD